MTFWNSLAHKWVSFSVRRPWLILGIAILISIISVFLATGIKIRGDFAALLPDHYRSIRGLEAITKKVGGLGFSMVVVEGKDPKGVKRLTETLGEKFSKLKTYVRFVQYYKIDPYIRDRALYLVKPKDLKDLNKRLKALKRYIKYESRKRNPLVVDLSGPDDEKPKPVKFDDLIKKYNLHPSDMKGSGLIGTKDGKLAVIFLQVKGQESDLPFIKRMLGALQKTVKETLTAHPKRYGAGVKINYTGRYSVRYEDDKYQNRQLIQASLFSLGSVLILLLLYTRRKRSLALIGLPLLFGVLWTAGAIRIVTGGEINIMTAFIVAILFGLGIDFGIHLFSHYFQERKGANTLPAALEISISSTGASGIVAVLTSAAAFFIIQLTDFKGLSQFGMVAGIGLLIILVTMLSVFPALSAILERKSSLGPEVENTQPKRHTSKVDVLRLEMKPQTLPWAAGLLFGALMLAGGVGVVWTGALKFEYNIWKLISQTNAVKTYTRLKKNVFGGEAEPGIIMLKSHKDLIRVQKGIEVGRQAGNWKTIRSVYSIHSFLPSAPKTQHRLLKRIHRTLSSRAFRSVPEEKKPLIETLKKLSQAKPYTMKDMPTNLRGFLGNGLPLLYVVPGIDPMKGNRAIMYASDLMDIDKKLMGGKMLLADTNYILAQMFMLLTRDGPRAVLFAFIAVLLVLLISLRSDIGGIFLVLAPLVVGLSGMLFFMWLFGFTLNPFNIIMLPVTLGIGIDHGVYMYRRWTEKGRGPVWVSLRPLYSAVLLAAGTSLLGFGSLMTAQHAGIQSIGSLAAIGILCTTLSAFIVLSTLLSMLAYRRYQKLSEDVQSIQSSS